MAESVVETLIDMILIGSEERQNKDEIVKYTSDWLKDLGMEVDIVGDNIFFFNNNTSGFYNSLDHRFRFFFFIIFSILRIMTYCLSSSLTSFSLVPEPRATRLTRE